MIMDEDKETEKNIDLPKEIFEELEKISKMEDSIDTFNKAVKKSSSLSEDKKEENVIKKDEISTILSAKEKKRYENLGKSFMEGANAVINDIQQSIEKKERNSLEAKDNIEKKIKEAKEEKEKDEKKKSSVVGKILIATAAIGALYLIFHETINSGIMKMYDYVKNGMIGFGDFIKKSASSIFSFFGNMFIKASESLSGGGVLNIILVGIIKEFFGFTLPNLVIHITQDLVRTVDKSFTASKWEPSDYSKKADEKEIKDAERGVEGVLLELGKARLNFEKDILKDGSLLIEEQEELADAVIKSLTIKIESLIKENEIKNTSEMGKWMNSIVHHLASNQIASTAFYTNAKTVIEGFERLGTDFNNLTDIQKTAIDNFAVDYGAMLGMSQKAIEEYEKMNGDDKIKFVKTLLETLRSHNAEVLKTVDGGKTDKDGNKKEEDSVVKILQDIKNDVKKKGATTTIVEFQETQKIGELHETIKSFINDTNFCEVIRKFSISSQNKLSMVMDASNKVLARLSKDIASEFILETVENVEGNKKVSKNKVESGTEDTIVVPDDSDYKIMYIFNNTATSNDDNVLNNMNEFFTSTVQYLQILKEESESVTKLEALSQYLYTAIFQYTKYVGVLNNHFREKFGETNLKLNTHMSLPVGTSNNSAHTLSLSNDSTASLIAPGGGMSVLGLFGNGTGYA